MIYYVTTAEFCVLNTKSDKHKHNTKIVILYMYNFFNILTSSFIYSWVISIVLAARKYVTFKVVSNPRLSFAYISYACHGIELEWRFVTMIINSLDDLQPNRRIASKLRENFTKSHKWLLIFPKIFTKCIILFFKYFYFYYESNVLRRFKPIFAFIIRLTVYYHMFTMTLIYYIFSIAQLNSWNIVRL